MALVEPLVGHLLSQYKETVMDGFTKIVKNAEVDPTFTPAFVSNPQGLEALRTALHRPEYAVPVLNTVCALITSCDSTAGSSGSTTSTNSSSSARSSIIRYMCSGKQMALLRKALTALSDDTLPLCTAALQLLALAARHHPKLVLARFDGKVPLHLACFRAQVPYSQRRIRAARTSFLLSLVASKHAVATATVVSSHGYLTHLLEDAAELLQEGTTAGLELGKQALKVFEEQFITSHVLSRAQKVSILMAQRNIFRLLVKALEYPPVADTAAAIIYKMVVEMMESPADYASTRAEAADDKGMPNFTLFFLLRQLRPKNSALVSRIVVFILNKAPDLIRPYFTRISGHLADEGNSARMAQSTSRIATLNLMTRIFMSPIPYHLSALRVRLQPVASKSSTFYNMSPRDVADEVCPLWFAEYVHRLINSNSNLMTLALAIQVTQASLLRAKTVLELIAQVQQQEQQRKGGAAGDEEAVVVLEGDNDLQEDTTDWEAFDASVQNCLLAALPSREEFWHRMTQQIHPMMLNVTRDGSSTGSASRAKIEFVVQRMLLLMESYNDVFQLRCSWLSAVPTYLPTFQPGPHPIAAALENGRSDVLSNWSPVSVSALCSLLVASLERGVPMVKLHHITVTNAKGGITEWPVLLSLLLWAVKRRETAGETDEEALAWIARLVQWTAHSVTVFFGCEYEEAVLWVHLLNEHTITCFVHMVNHLMQRSLSKAADRVAQELLAGEHGVLVAAAEAFIVKTEEKQQGAAGAAATAPPPLAGANSKSKGKGMTGTMPAQKHVDLWADDLKDSLPAFKKLVASVSKQWISRKELAGKLLHRVYASSTRGSGGAQRGQRQLALMQYQVTSSQVRALLSEHEQLLSFYETLHSPVQAEAEVEIKLQELVAALTPTSVRTPLIVSAGGKKDAASSVLAHIKEQDVSRWCLMPALTWELAGRLLQELSEVKSTRATNIAEGTAKFRTLLAFVKDLLSIVAAAATSGTLITALLEQRDSVTIGFFVLLLTCTRVLLTARATKEGLIDIKDWDVLCASDETEGGAAVRDAVVSVLMRTYCTTLTATDRVRYACLLTIHYLNSRSDAARNEVPDNADVDSEVSGRDDVEGEEEDAVADDGGKMMQKNDRKSGGKQHGNSSNHGKRPTEDEEQRVYSGARVPSCIMTSRFLALNHFPAPNATPETDMLTLLTDSWTDEELLNMALECPGRLHNTILCGAQRPAWDLLRSVFPEVTCEEDLHVTPFARVSSASVVDPRYLLPLLQSVVSIPLVHLPHRFMGTRCNPLLVRALSFTDATLRSLAAAALDGTFVPNGPGRVIVGFVRMKATQLATKRKSGTASEAAAIPRIPAPLTAFLVLALKPLAHFEHPLHNHIIRFLCDTTEAFATPVPFASWLTGFPLGCVSMPLMLKNQEELQRWSGTTSSIAQASAAEVAEQLRREAPPQLAFIETLISHSCQTNGDAMALIQSECLDSLMVLSDMLASSPELRLGLIECLGSVCETSFAVAAQATSRARLLMWLLSFSLHLCAEYGMSRTHPYSEPLFLAVLELLRKLCLVVKATGGSTDAVTREQVAGLLALLRAQLAAANVTAKTTLDAVDGMIALWAEEMGGTPQFAHHHYHNGNFHVGGKRGRSPSEHTRGNIKSVAQNSKRLRK